MHVLITGAAGFIGYHLTEILLARGDTVVGLDNLNDYYDVNIKRARLARLQQHAGFRFLPMDLTDRDGMSRLFVGERFQAVVNLAAQAGVRYSLSNPHAYVDSNVVGFINVLEGCRHGGVEHLVYASSSSVYGANARLPFSEHSSVDHPLSLYAATKKANELMAHTYAHLYGLPCTGLRFFTVYGPWGRPDMALFLFTRAILAGEPIDVYNNGQMQRDFTYVDDIVDGVVRVIDRRAASNPDWDGASPDPATSNAPYRIYNIGNHRSEQLLRYVELIEKAAGRKAQMRMLPMQAGDVPATYADVDDLARDTGFAPSTSIEVGVPKFVAWYRSYYGI